MFRKTESVQVDMFRDMATHVSERKLKLLGDPAGWHNQFYKEVVRRIDEEQFSVLYVKDNGRPNASLKVLLGMIILKEGNGWSDEQLFDQARFNLKVMSALGLAHLDDDVPVESTYYEFRKRLGDYNEKHGCDLIKKCFQDITGKQIECHNVSGKKIRMDSKLIQSNIAKSTRLELILEAVRKHIGKMDISALGGTFSKADIELLEAIKQKKATNIAYPLDNGQKQSLLKKLGLVIKGLLAVAGSTPGSGCILQRIYDEQYEEVPCEDKSPGGAENEGEGEGPTVRPGSQIPTSSIQSVHDPEAAYRSKGKGNNTQQVSGYHSNITETCDENNSCNLIVHVMVAPANETEDKFMVQAIEESEQILQQAKNGTGPQKIEQATTDGGYDSYANRDAMQSEGMPQWNLQKHKGAEKRYHMARDGAGNLTAFCKKTNRQCEVGYSQKTGKHVITHEDKTKRYFTEEQINKYLQIQEILSKVLPEDANIRANVEATIHQVFHRLEKRQKIRYRGLYKCQMYAFSRAFWANFRRILKKDLENTVFWMVFLLLSPIKALRPDLAHPNPPLKNCGFESGFEI